MPALRRSLFLSSVALCTALLAAPVAADEVAIGATLSEPIYEIGDTMELTITGPPGGWVFLIFAARLDTVEIGGIGTFGVAFDPWPVILDVGFLPASGELVLSDTTLCSRLDHANKPLFIQAAVLPPGTWLPACTAPPVKLLRVNGDGCPRCVDEPTTNPLVSSESDGTALELSDTGGAFTVGPATQFSEYKDGTARISTILCSTTDGESGYCAEFTFSDRLDCQDFGFPPLGAPKLDLFASAYYLGGGPIDPDGWHYYGQLQGQLVGFGALAGSVVELVGNGSTQVGLGANGRSGAYGLCALVDATVVAQPTSGAQLADTLGGELLLGEIVCPAPVEAVVRGTVFYDFDADGVFDPDVPGEIPLVGWRVEIKCDGLVEVAFTDSEGHYEFVREAYSLCDLDSRAPLPGYVGIPGGRWYPTTPIAYDKVVVKPAEVVRDFGVLAMTYTPELATSKGYWHNQGQDELAACDPQWRELVNGLCLRKNTTVPYPPPPVDPTIFTVSESASFGQVFGQLSAFLVSPTHGVLANTLSKHYCAAMLNANCGPGAGNVIAVDQLDDDVLVPLGTMAANTLAVLCDPRSCDTGPGSDPAWKAVIQMCLQEWSGLGDGENYYSRKASPPIFVTPYEDPAPQNPF